MTLTIVQQIEGKICPIREPEVHMWTVNMDPVIYERQTTERRCTRECASFAENIVEGREAFEKTSTVFQYCRMWPGDK